MMLSANKEGTDKEVLPATKLDRQLKEGQDGAAMPVSGCSGWSCMLGRE